MGTIRADSASRPYAVSFDDDAAADTSVTGGKGANLARLFDAGFTVPPGFCVTTAAYRTLVTDSELQREIASLADLDPTAADRIREQSAAVRDRIRNAAFPDPIRETIDATLEGIDAEAVAVRSSATAEDLPTASFAGQHETFLGVTDGDALRDRVRDCMASLFTERAVSYRLQNDVSHADVAMAVVVQAMVEPDAAGVLFTADPVSGKRHVASVDANYGLGETVVTGEVSPDNARVDRRTGDVLEYEVGDKSHARRMRADRDGTESVDVAPSERESRVLSDAQLRDLVDLGNRVEDAFGEHQDIEWAFVDGEIVLLQSRPITTLFPLPSPAPDDDDLHVFFSIGHQQAMAEALPPLVVDWVREMLNSSAARLQPADADRPVTAEAGHRVYLDLNPLLENELSRRVAFRILAASSEPAANAVEELLDERTDSVPTPSLANVFRPIGRAIRRLGPAIGTAAPAVIGRFLRPFVRSPPDAERVRHRVELKGEQMAARVTRPSSQARQVRNAFESVDHGTLVATVGSQSMPLLVAGIAAGNALELLHPDAADELEAIGKGFDDAIATQINQRLAELIELAREHPAVAAAIEDDASLEAVERVDGGSEFVAAFDAFLDDFGCRASSEIDLSRPRWRDDPAILFRTIRSALADDDARNHDAHLEGLKADAERAIDDLETRAGRGPLGAVKKPLVRRLIRAYRGGIQLREHHKHGVSRFITAVRDVFVAAGESLAADGRLDRPEDVWYLRKDELIAALEDDAPIGADIDDRRGTHDRYASMTAPPILTSEGETPTVTAAPDAELTANALVGTPVSSGVVEGTARVVTDPSEASLESGEILVAPSTDVGWTPLFQNASGLVMEVGGQMTHGALVAREYGIPAVVSVSNATAEIESGERVRISGRRGTVERLDRSDESAGAATRDGTDDGT